MDGILNIYKPTGMTSFDVIRVIKRLSGMKKVGHTGTLDPLASGVLPICLGKATKIVDYIMSDFKIYKTELRLGITTDTYDREGKIQSSRKVDSKEDEIISVINSFKGNILQVPPMYSALKLNGKRLYELARSGTIVQRKARPITIYDIEILNISIPFVSFKVKCSKGTYIRSLCYDIGDKLRCGATMWNLERVQSGKYHKKDAIKLEELNELNIGEYLISMGEALSDYDKIVVNEKTRKLLCNGVRVGDKSLLKDIQLEKLYRIYSNDNKFLGLGLRNNDGLKIEKLLI